MMGNKSDKWTNQIYVLFRHMILEILESLPLSHLLIIIYQVN